ncbi:NAD-dependent epimerase/dehydratase family protein [Streptomyces sp. YC504]|uniref:NAD-dependent epimerase/dehydratase family protein n=1 Tax=Streptomyces mesophilus TaxID=1775132 RepID=A0A6G4XLT9_9ACTN|nr:NAD-dependent epimerase/dehydratase family protein [Streptomyces mesophilus]NGO78152.1 NAD-dependent epimerase/dehydratase family protein [Streptomyces mesophilus]
MQRICVIGGSRYFGKLLVERLRAAGHQVTVINRGSTVPPAGVEHLAADRDDEAALVAALGARTFDVVVDQVCYTPVQAAIAARVFRDRARRYVMTSTIEVYDPATADLPVPDQGVPVSEAAVDPASWRVRADLPWHDDAYLETHYAEGKRQAEAVFTQDGGYAFMSVRSAHVLGGGALEFTGRLAHYVDRVLGDRPVAVHADPLPTAFVHYAELAALLHWAATGTDVTGPLNACSGDALDVYGLVDVIASRTGRTPAYETVAAGQEASPFSFDRHYAMSNARAEKAGFIFSRTRDWLPQAVDEALAVHGH